ncbi:MAG TPA: M48 family metalloprotease, partial [Afifellaceae bacterium]|nr:M48 family metalloprotease [Afifellaceae bacterium]
EIEALLRDYAAPLFKAAGIGSRGAEIIIINDRAFNAFVVSGNRMFINSGTLLTAETPNEVIGVIAHETGHLAGGHLQGLRNEVARAQSIGVIATLLGVGAMVAGVNSGSDTGARAGGAIAQAGPQLALRTLLNYRRGQETAADRAAITYLNATGQSAKGMITTFQRFADQALFSKQYVDPYVLSHPMATDRIAQLENVARKSKYWDAQDPAQLQLRHDLMRAKLAGFMEGPGRVARRFPKSDKSAAAEYARAIVAYRSGGIRRAGRQIDRLISMMPNNPYLYELKGQALLEGGKANAAIAPLRKSVSLAPRAGLIRILLGHAQLETGNKGLLDEAVQNLRTGLQQEPLASVGYRHLATAYARQGRIGDAELATARGHLIDGQLKTAQTYAKRAQAKLKRGSPGWLQADDILSYKLPKAQR